ncbi:MAG: hypothetical protein HY973_02045 [Candidatus Kerfeldbacteria bacterium]|nr:hypothetical protein [Candidatus Kerfeldbacteria bacterium]
MSIDAKELQQFGLTEKESALYLAALELGSAFISDLARKSQLKRPTTYLVVNQLEVMGLFISN